VESTGSDSGAPRSHLHIATRSRRQVSDASGRQAVSGSQHRFTVQKSAVDRGIVKQFPLILSSGRLVEYEGGGEETRSNKWLAD